MWTVQKSPLTSSDTVLLCISLYQPAPEIPWAIALGRLLVWQWPTRHYARTVCTGPLYKRTQLVTHKFIEPHLLSCTLQIMIIMLICSGECSIQVEELLMFSGETFSLCLVTRETITHRDRPRVVKTPVFDDSPFKSQGWTRQERLNYIIYIYKLYKEL